MLPPTRLPEIHNDASKIQLERLSHVYFDHPDLDKFQQFALDFGLVKVDTDHKDAVFYRGYGKDPYCYVARKSATGKPLFGGGAWLAQTEADFDKAVAMDGASVTDLSDLPGGGRKVTLRSPAGLLMHIVHGIQDRQLSDSVPSAQVETRGPMNSSMDKQRFGKFQRFHLGPALVHKVGHYGFIVSEWDKEIRWYTGNFNFVPSDVLYEASNEEVDTGAFLHLDLGERYSDHHSLFLFRAPPGEHDRMHHTSYEVEDFDTQIIGHYYLAGKQYKSVWGVGRHILGSQIFDYWRDPTGFTIEHYADGDLVNASIPTKRSQAGPLSVWGPEMTAEMMADGTLPATD